LKLNFSQIFLIFDSIERDAKSILFNGLERKNIFHLPYKVNVQIKQFLQKKLGFNGIEDLG
jgi:hypothetical protein